MNKKNTRVEIDSQSNIVSNNTHVSSNNKSNSNSSGDSNSNTTGEVMFDLNAYCKIEFPKDLVPYKRRKPEIFTAIKVVNKNNYKRYQPTYYLAQR